MRIADKMTSGQVDRNLAKNRSQMADLQNHAATQKRVTKPSDDPVAAARVLASRVDLSSNQQFNKSLKYAKSFLEYTDQSLGDLTENLVRVKELALGQASDASSSPDSKRVVAKEVEQIYNQMVQIGNRKLGDRFIFGGYKTQQSPFAGDGTYQGDKGEIMIPTDKQSFVAMNIPGSKVFMGDGLSSDGISRATEQQALTIEQFKQRQSESQKDSQESDSVDSKNPNLRAPASESSAKSPQDLGPREESSQSGVNLFNAVEKLYVALNTNDKAGIQDSIVVLDDAISQVVLARAQVGSRSMALENVEQTLMKAKVDNKTVISELEDADVFETISEMNKTESALQATIQTSGKLLQPSLLDFLR